MHRILARIRIAKLQSEIRAKAGSETQGVPVRRKRALSASSTGKKSPSPVLGRK
ncbi:hypothetical protein ISF_06179 [Cordyceps fumosorosea ARSEF 2679]|uniref:Uncharacterized protein n=1 Tax=Cordyceps fumosorosea (strain ARSEF 2679) TaxID=1081104 RepID=A0A167T243_CORFA|nr:hypothetical protein ISF_06179 [Cordyceps fumosorosea ARSEF 2679]OAA60169.1 hypothetical protein ISF_06179 [Cordyceps fumosorosea ARSEF 2679]